MRAPGRAGDGWREVMRRGGPGRLGLRCAPVSSEQKERKSARGDAHLAQSADRQRLCGRELCKRVPVHGCDRPSCQARTSWPRR